MGLVAALENMKGNSDIFRYVEEINSSLHANGIRLQVTWEPRDTPSMETADWLSRQEDSGKMFTSHKTFVDIASRFAYPHLDAFAGSEKGMHVTTSYFTQYPSAGSIGTDAFVQNWRVPRTDGNLPLVYAFPPSGRELETINLIAEQQVDTILVLPAFGDLVIWQQHIRRRRLPVKEKAVFPYKAGLYWTGTRAPAWLQHKTAALNVYLVLW